MVVSTEYYDLLGVSPTATDEEIRRGICDPLRACIVVHDRPHGIRVSRRRLISGSRWRCSTKHTYTELPARPLHKYNQASHARQSSTEACAWSQFSLSCAGLTPVCPISANAGYLRQARQWHPDKCGGSPEAESRFKEINDAWKVRARGHRSTIKRPLQPCTQPEREVQPGPHQFVAFKCVAVSSCGPA